MQTDPPRMRHDSPVSSYRIPEAAQILGVSDDTVRRWIEAGRLETADEGGRTIVPGRALADLAVSLTDDPESAPRAGSVSARNRLPGIVTRVVKDTVMAQVELICGPYRLVSLMSSEAAE